VCMHACMVCMCMHAWCAASQQATITQSVIQTILSAGIYRRACGQTFCRLRLNTAAVVLCGWVMNSGCLSSCNGQVNCDADQHMLQIKAGHCLRTNFLIVRDGCHKLASDAACTWQSSRPRVEWQLSIKRRPNIYHRLCLLD